MSLRANIDHLSAAQGIEAVAVLSQSSELDFRGDSTWKAVLEGSLSLLDRTDESTIRLVVGKHTVVVQTENEETVAVVLPTGHAIAKSLRRMIRRMSRKVRAPLSRMQDVQPPHNAHSTPASISRPADPTPSAYITHSTPPSTPAPAPSIASPAPVPSASSGTSTQPEGPQSPANPNEPLTSWG